MKKIILGSLVAAATLFGATASSTYVQALEQFLAQNQLPVNGEFYAYDFGKDGKIDYNDWVYVTVPNGDVFRLLAVEPSDTNVFGFAKIEKPADLSTQPNGYFTALQNFSMDTDPRFAWVYVTKDGDVYKLMGATPQNTFDYLDIDGNGTPDPLPNIKASVNIATIPGVDSLSLTFTPINTQLGNYQGAMGQGNMGGMTDVNHTTPNVISPLTTDINAEQRYEIAWMWNEEKMAHDLYLNLYNLYSNDPAAQPLYNIATRSEIRHMDSALSLAKAYDVNVSDDFLGSFDENVVNSLGLGEFAVSEIQALYDQLYAKGSLSLKDALEVGCIVEVTDVEDLNKALEVAQDNLDMVNVFTFLRQGSYNHYWAFDNALKNMGVADGCCSLGDEYCKTPEEFPTSNNGHN